METCICMPILRPLRVELRCKFHEKLHRVTGPLLLESPFFTLYNYTAAHDTFYAKIFHNIDKQ